MASQADMAQHVQFPFNLQTAHCRGARSGAIQVSRYVQIIILGMCPMARTMHQQVMTTNGQSLHSVPGNVAIVVQGAALLDVFLYFTDPQ